MRIQTQSLHCVSCQHEWLGEMLVEADVRAVTALMKTVYCPSCGADWKKVAFGRGRVPVPKAAVTTGLSDYDRRAHWLKLHDNGLSSECIADVMCGSKTNGSHPSDGNDFGRCERLLALYPEWRTRLGEMADVSPYWAALVPRWGEIADAWRADLNSKRGHACWDLMRSILEPIEAEDSRIVRFGSGVTMRFGS